MGQHDAKDSRYSKDSKERKGKAMAGVSFRLRTDFDATKGHGKDLHERLR